MGRFEKKDGGGDLKKAKNHYETAAMAGHELAQDVRWDSWSLNQVNRIELLSIGRLLHQLDIILP